MLVNNQYGPALTLASSGDRATCTNSQSYLLTTICIQMYFRCCSHGQALAMPSACLSFLCAWPLFIYIYIYIYMCISLAASLVHICYFSTKPTPHQTPHINLLRLKVTGEFSQRGPPNSNITSDAGCVEEKPCIIKKGSSDSHNHGTGSPTFPAWFHAD